MAKNHRRNERNGIEEMASMKINYQYREMAKRKHRRKKEKSKAKSG